MLVIAVLLWRRPAASSAVLACAGCFKLAPFALVPIWLAPLRGKRLLAAAAAIAGVTAAMAGVLIGLGGANGVGAMIHAVGFQFQRGSFQSPWKALGLTSLQPVAQAGVLAVIAATAVRLRRAPALFRERHRVAALSAAVLLGLQLTADYWAFLYLVWIVPLIGMSLFADPAPAASRTAELVSVRRPRQLAPGLIVAERGAG
jgi:hypothetical protein